MIPPQTQQVLDFLGNPASYAHHPAEVTLHQTHASWVFVASPYVYKIKKPVDFGFMDFTTLEKRKANCEREVTLNRRLTEDIYLGVEAISLRDGELQFGVAGEVVEWAVKMREMDPRDFLSHLAAEHRLEKSHIDRVIDKLVKFYQSQPPLDQNQSKAAFVQLLHNEHDNFITLNRFVPQCFSETALDVVTAFRGQHFSMYMEKYEARWAEGRYRDCHGDLHLEHIHITPEQINIYDCIEFNPAYRMIDVANDVAFLAMDLDFNGEFELSRYLIDQFAQQLNDPDMPILIDRYKCYRAQVRGKVEALRSTGDGLDDAERARSIALSRCYFQLALRYALSGSTPTAFVFLGKVGSGKSFLAKALAEETGWLVHSSDMLRKTLAGVSLTERGTEQQRSSLYSTEMTRRVYDALADAALMELNQGRNVILDATFSSRAQRNLIREKLADKRRDIVWIEATASDDTRRARLQARGNDSQTISDAREEDRRTLDALFEPVDECSPIEHVTVSTDLFTPTVRPQLGKYFDRYVESWQSKPPLNLG